MTKLSICHLSEGIAGHDGQALGIIKTLKDAGFDIKATTIKVEWRIRPLRGVLRFISRKLTKCPNSLSIKIISFCYKFIFPEGINVIISSGANLAPLNLALAKKYKLKNIHLSTPRDWDISDFTAYVTSSKVSNSYSNLVPDIIPNLFDPKECEKQGKRFIDENDIQDTQFSLLILGGDGIGYSYQREEWHEIVEKFINFSKSNATVPLFITSRRTPQNVEDYIKNNHNSDMSVFYHSERARGKFDHLLFVSKYIFVTEDSSTMISEAISSGKKIVSIFPKTINAPNKYKNIIAKYENLGFIERCKIKNIDEFSFLEDADISEVVQKSIKNFQNSLSDRLKD